MNEKRRSPEPDLRAPSDFTICSISSAVRARCMSILSRLLSIVGFLLFGSGFFLLLSFMRIAFVNASFCTSSYSSSPWFAWDHFPEIVRPYSFSLNLYNIFHIYNIHYVYIITYCFYYWVCLVATELRFLVLGFNLQSSLSFSLFPSISLLMSCTPYFSSLFYFI